MAPRTRLRALAAVGALVAVAARHACIHDNLLAERNASVPFAPVFYGAPAEARDLQASGGDFKPLRIVPIVGTGDDAQPGAVMGGEFVREGGSDTLWVPFVGNGFYRVASTACAQCGPDVCAIAAGAAVPAGTVSSLLPSLGAFSCALLPAGYRVPSYSFFTSSAALNGFFRAVISVAIQRWSRMLSLVPVSGPLSAFPECYTARSTGICTGYATDQACDATPADDIKIPFTTTFRRYYTNLAAYEDPGTAGLAGGDYGLFVIVKQTSKCGTGGSGTEAYALSCQRDARGRPTYGRITFCPSMFNPSSLDSFTEGVATALHEIAHALGFSSDSWPAFLFPDGTPRTQRDSYFPTDPVGIRSSTSSGYFIRGIPLTGCGTTQFADKNTVDYSVERGMSCAWTASQAYQSLLPYSPATSPLKTPSDCVARIVTPAVQRAARVFFDCPTLAGAELENQDTGTGCQAAGSHWDQRALNSELMAPYSQHVSLVSPMTLAVFEDSGWGYRPDYTQADAWRAGDWGFHAGCAFAGEKTCKEVPQPVASVPPYFYFSGFDSTGYMGWVTSTGVCTTDRRAVGSVTTKAYPTLPSQYRYFSDATTGGSLKSADYCPLPQASTGLVCAGSPATDSRSTYNGETFLSSASRCHTSTLVATGVSASYFNKGAGCYLTSCPTSSGNTSYYNVTVRTGSGGALLATCSAAGQVLVFAGFSGSLTCADPATLCAPAAPVVPPSPSSSPSITPSLTPSNTPSPTSTVSLSPSLSSSGSQTPTASSSVRPWRVLPSASPTPSPMVGSVEVAVRLALPAAVAGQVSNTTALEAATLVSSAVCVAVGVDNSAVVAVQLDAATTTLTRRRRALLAQGGRLLGAANGLALGVVVVLDAAACAAALRSASPAAVISLSTLAAAVQGAVAAAFVSGANCSAFAASFADPTKSAVWVGVGLANVTDACASVTSVSAAIQAASISSTAGASTPASLAGTILYVVLAAGALGGVCVCGLCVWCCCMPVKEGTDSKPGEAGSAQVLHDAPAPSAPSPGRYGRSTVVPAGGMASPRPPSALQLRTVLADLDARQLAALRGAGALDRNARFLGAARLSEEQEDDFKASQLRKLRAAGVLL